MKIDLGFALRNITSLRTGFLMLGIVLLITACGGTRSAEDLQDFEELSELVNSREFEIQNEWAMPSTGSTVNLIGNTNYIRFKGDSVEVFLPYFGVRHSGGRYGGGQGIEYEGPAKKLDIEEKREKNRIVLKFEGRQGTESMQFTINLSSGKSTSTMVNSSERSGISYRGNVQELPE